MAKTIKITFYNPKELWRMFWNWVYWPRRKQCAEWLSFLQGQLEYKIVNDVLIGKYYNEGLIDADLCDKLELDIKPAIDEILDKFVDVLKTPIPLDDENE